MMLITLCQRFRKDVQTTLDVHLKDTPKTRPVTRQGLMEYIIELIVVDSKVRSPVTMFTFSILRTETRYFVRL